METPDLTSRSSIGRARRAGLAATVWAGLAGLAASAPAEDRPNAPESCPYCEGDPERMRASGVLSHGGFEFALTDTHGVDDLLSDVDIHWAETPHFELGIALGSYKLESEERSKVRAELTELAAALPAINPKTRVLDPWLRIHLYAVRVERLWDRTLEVLGVREQDFPDGKGYWVFGTPYFGEGPYLGQGGKYEVLIVPTEAVHVAFLRDQFGLSITKTQRWNVVERDSLLLSIHTRQGGLRNDQALHGHVAFTLSTNLLDGYKHYSYDTPVWIQEGLSHLLEREIDPRFNTFDSDEGSVAQTTRKSDWTSEVKKTIRSGEAPRMAELVSLRTYAELELRHHYATWSMTVFLIEEHPEAYACLNGRIHGRKDEKGYPDGSNMPDVHREAFQECLGMSYPEFDRAWSEWALAQE